MWRFVFGGRIDKVARGIPVCPPNGRPRIPILFHLWWPADVGPDSRRASTLREMSFLRSRLCARQPQAHVPPSLRIPGGHCRQNQRPICNAGATPGSMERNQRSHSTSPARETPPLRAILHLSRWTVALSFGRASSGCQSTSAGHRSSSHNGHALPAQAVWATLSRFRWVPPVFAGQAAQFAAAAGKG